MNSSPSGRRNPPAVLVVLLVAILAVSLTASCGTKSFSKQELAKLESVVDVEIQTSSLPGAVVGVWEPKQGTWVVAKGKSDLAAGTPMNVKDKFRIASITKSFTATLALQLAGDGKLSLDAPVSTYVPNIANGDKMTVRQLMNHTSGIADEDPEGKLHQALAHDPFKKWSPMDVYLAYTGGKVQNEPGKYYEYSNAGYIVLGMVVEKTSGKTVDQLLKDKITGPLGLKDTYFPTGPDITPPFAHGYDGKNDVTKMDMSWDWTAGAMLSTLNDLKVWAKALATGKLLTPQMHSEQLTWVDVPGGKGQLKYGLGVENVFGFIGHNGGDPGYQSVMRYLPDKDTTIVVLVNKLTSDGSDLQASGRIADGISNVLYPGIIPDWYLQLTAPKK